MNLYTINTGYFKLDGGAMFGVVPKILWSRNQPSDENNLCTWAMRLLLIEEGERLILIDTGIGDKQSDKFFSHYHLHGGSSIDQALNEHGFKPDDITDVLLTHLHFDHVGGAIVKNEKEELVTKFKNANYWSDEKHWEWATHPNDREKASFLEENILPIKASGQLKFIEKGNELGENISFLKVNGHTESQLIPHIHYKGKTIVFVADLLPSVNHIPIPYIPSYDVRPLESLKEKANFFEKAIEQDYYLFLEHDANYECCNLKMGKKGAKLNETFLLSDIL